VRTKTVEKNWWDSAHNLRALGKKTSGRNRIFSGLFHVCFVGNIQERSWSNKKMYSELRTYSLRKKTSGRNRIFSRKFRV